MTTHRSHRPVRRPAGPALPHLAARNPRHERPTRPSAPHPPPGTAKAPHVSPSSFPGLGARTRHAPCQAANIILQRDILPLQLVVVGLDALDALCQRAKARLQDACVPRSPPGATPLAIVWPLPALAAAKRQLLGVGKGSRGVGRESYSCTAARVSWLSLAVSELLRRGLMARASSGG